MGKRGPPKTPTRILEMKGSWRAKLNPNEPEPKVLTDEDGIPEMLDPSARKFWKFISRQLFANQVLTEADESMVCLLVESFAEYEELKERCKTEKRTLFTEKHWPAANPIFAEKNKAYDRYVKTAKEFGLSPASRAGVQKATGKPKGKKDDILRIG